MSAMIFMVATILSNFRYLLLTKMTFTWIDKSQKKPHVCTLMNLTDGNESIDVKFSCMIIFSKLEGRL